MRTDVPVIHFATGATMNPSRSEEKPTDVWAPIAIAVAELLSDVSPGRLRKCEACILHFLDTSKRGSRRWCSMNICGNKIKVAAYQQRKRAAEKKMRRRR